MKKFFRLVIFFVGWVLSPFTWWNDAVVNIPLSYLTANLLFYLTHFSFLWLVIGSYWLTNALGIFLMYLGGKYLILSSKHRIKVTVLLIISILIYSAIMIYLHDRGKLMPLEAFWGKYCVDQEN